MFVGDLSPEVTEYMLVVCVIAANSHALCEDVATKTEKKEKQAAELRTSSPQSTTVETALRLIAYGVNTYVDLSSRPRSKNGICPADRQRS